MDEYIGEYIGNGVDECIEAFTDRFIYQCAKIDPDAQ